MLKSINHLSLMCTDVCLQHNSLLPQTVEEGNVAYWLQHNALLPQTPGGREHSSLTSTQHINRGRFWHCIVGKVCHVLRFCHAVMDDTASLAEQTTIFNWIMVIVFDTLFKVSPALISPFRSYCHWNLDAIQQLLAWWEDGIRSRQLHNLERVLLGWLPQMKLVVVFCYSK